MKSRFLLYLIGFLLFTVQYGIGQTFNEITDVGDLTNGEYLIVGDGSTNKGLMLNEATSFIQYTELTSSPGSSINSEFTGDNIFEITVDDNGNITIYNPDAGYVSYSGSGNSANFQSDVTDKERWTPSVDNNLWVLENINYPGRILQWNNSAPRFAAYTSSQVKLRLFKKEEAGTSVSVNPNSLTGFEYIENNGPSASQSFTLNGSNLDSSESIEIILSDDFWELSSDDSNWSSSLEFQNYDGTSTTVYVRMISGLTADSYEDTVMISGYGFDLEVSLTGMVSGSDMTVDPDELTGFNYMVNNGPSASQNFNLSGVNLNGSENIELVLADDFWELSLNNADWTNSIELENYTGDNTTVYARMISGLSAGSYEDTVMISGYGFDLEVSLSGTVSAPATQFNKITTVGELTPGNYLIAGFKNDDAKALGKQNNNNRASVDVIVNSGSPDYIMTGAAPDNDNDTLPFIITIEAGSEGGKYYLKDNVNGTYLVPAPSGNNNYLKGQSDPSDWTITFDQDGNAVITNVGHPNTNGRNIIRFNSTSNPNLFSCYSSGQSDVYLFKEPTEDPVLNAIPGSLDGFTYNESSGPSDSQSFTLSGLNLDGSENVEFILTDDLWELSLNDEDWFSSLEIVNYTGADTDIYVRMVGGLAADIYEDTVMISGYGYDLEVSLEGEVFGAVLEADPDTLSDFSYMVGEGPSASKSFDLSGENLSGTENIEIVLIDDLWELSLNDEDWFDFIELENYDGTETAIYVRMISGLAVDDYEDTILISGYGQDLEVSLSGMVIGSLPCNGSEDFEGETGLTNSYQSGSFTGNNGFVWQYTDARNEGDYEIDGKGITFRTKDSTYDPSLKVNLHDAGTLSFQARKAFTGGSNNRKLEVYVDDVLYYATPSFGETGNDETIHDFQVDLNFIGMHTVMIKNAGAQVTLDNIEWNCFSPDFVYIDGSWTPNNPDGTDGDASASTDIVYVANGTAEFTDDVILKDLVVNSSAEIKTEKNLAVAGNIVNHGLVTFSSSADGTGQLDEFAGEIRGNGNFVAEAYMPARRAFRFFSSAVDTENGSKPFIRNNWQEGANNTGTDFPNDNQNPNPGYGTHITGSQTGANGFDATPSGNKSLFGFDNITQDWTNIPNTDGTYLEAGTAYRIMIRGDRGINITDDTAIPVNTVIRTTGFLKTGDVVFNDLSPIAEDPNLIGNPYQATVDMNAVISASTNINDNYYYVWDPMLGGQPTPGQPGGRGAYVTVNLIDGSNTSGSTANQYLQPGQAGFVETLNNGAASVTFKEEHKNVAGLHGKMNQTETASINILMYETSAFENNYTASDGVLILFSEDGDNAITEKDAYKYLNLDENISTLNGEEQFSIENRALPVHQETIPLYTDQYRYDNYVLKLSAAGLPEDINAYLWDKFTDTYTQFQNDGETHYAFELDFNNSESISENRFEVVFEEEGSMNINELNTSGIVLYPNPIQNNQFTLDSKQYAGEELSIKVFSMSGKVILNTIINVPSNGRVEIDLPASTSNGIHAVTVSNRNKVVFTSKIIKK